MGQTKHTSTGSPSVLSRTFSTLASIHFLYMCSLLIILYVPLYYKPTAVICVSSSRLLLLSIASFPAFLHVFLPSSICSLIFFAPPSYFLFIASHTYSVFFPNPLSSLLSESPSHFLLSQPTLPKLTFFLNHPPQSSLHSHYLHHLHFVLSPQVFSNHSDILFLRSDLSSLLENQPSVHAQTPTHTLKIRAGDTDEDFKSHDAQEVEEEIVSAS